MDSIANMLTTIRNISILNKQEAIIPHSIFKSKILEILKKNNHIKDFETTDKEGKKLIKIKLLQKNGTAAIESIKLISKPGRRIYAKAQEIPRSLGTIVISTSGGLMDQKAAKKKKIGGELICEVI